ncbi:MAG: nitrate reductase molybdenum cofactor assembly chaperone [Gammaproteobacteria bacterium]
MKALKAIGLLLHYPEVEVIEHTDELAAVLDATPGFTPDTRQKIIAFMRQRHSRDLLNIQGEYVALFDRGRSLSLHLFEHVHGESRDRGQAMVDLLETYRQQGLDISANELPDYLPIFLEFCSILPESEASNWLQEIEHLLQLLHSRLETRENPYSILFKALLEIGGLDGADAAMYYRIENEKRDDTPQALDSVWAEEPVIFGPTEGCGGAITNKGQAVPVDTSRLQQSHG